MAQFRTKARALELLGKGQIADLPTAISELWKNGYDAYGDNLEAFLYLTGYENIPSPLFVMSDDGKGMTRTDILEKWIVLGTDSKSRGNLEQRGEETLWKEPRIRMGEKGIGRLSVSYLGSQMLMVTKKIGSPTQVVFFDWRILDNYNLYLEDIIIPIRDVQTVEQFQEVFNELKQEYLSNFKEYTEAETDPWFEQKTIKENIVATCKNLQLPSFLEDDFLKGLIGDGNQIHGTKFLIFNPDTQLLSLQSSDNKAKGDEEDFESIYHLRSSLLGLFNSFKDENKPYQTHFWIVNNQGRYDFIEKREFFNPTDFNICDHVIDGTFDQAGKFDGTVRIFKQTLPHKFSPSRVITGNKTSYGSFSIKMGYVQGDRGFETPLLNGEERKSFLNKLNDYGGLYIYRDGFRVLPYGRTSWDFLEFEKRRNERVSTYFFSYRRMFGYIDISRLNNKSLEDKAGREGFKSNKAYLDFTFDLKSFFIDLAKTYFADDAKDETRKEIQNQYLELIDNAKLEHEREKADRNEFRKKLTQLPKELSLIENTYNSLIKELQNKLEQNSLTYQEVADILKRIEECRIKAENLSIKKPVRFKPTDLQKQNLHDYNQQLSKFMATVEKNSSTLILKAHETLKDQELLNEFHNRGKQYRESIANSFEDYIQTIQSNLNKLQAISDAEKSSFISEYEEKLAGAAPKEITRKNIGDSIKLLEKIFADIQKRINGRMRPFIDHLAKVSLDVNEDDLMGFYKLKYDDIREELEQVRELSQLGIAVEIIDHEFNVLYSQLSETINSVKEEMPPKKFKMLSSAFEHLENNYKLLQPLYRTTGRSKKEVTGPELFEYGEQFFNSKFEESAIKYRISKGAESYKINSFESIFKAVLINILNNAIYWLRKSELKTIEIDAIGEMLIIKNSGEPIHGALLEDIFKMFYSKRPQGRGIGLYLAKQSLQKLGFKIYATNDEKYNTLGGACFIIEPTKPE